MTDYLDVGLEDDDAVVTAQVCVTQFLSGGGTRYCVTTKGTSQISTLLGLLAMAQHDLLVENDES